MNTTVYVNDKRLAAKLYADVNHFCKKLGVSCFPLCGSTSDYTAKFKKWKIELLWYENPKSSKARVYFDTMKIGHRLQPIFAERFKLGKKLPTTIDTMYPYIELLDVIGPEFKDEIDLEDYLRRISPLDIKTRFSISVGRIGGREQDPQRQTTEKEGQPFDKKTNYDINRAVENYVIGKDHDMIAKIKELGFIESMGMTRRVASQLDIPMRKRLEDIFPEISQFNILCFKRKDQITGRRALIFPQMYKYKEFMDIMLNFLTKNNLKEVSALESRIRISFKGKYILQIEDDIFRNFQTKITENIKGYNLQFNIKFLLKKREVTIIGSHEKVSDMRDCVKEIMGFLFPKPHILRPDLARYDLFSLKSNQGQNYINRLNNKFNGETYGKFDTRSNRLTIRGDQRNREHFIELLEQWVQKFNNKVKVDSFEVKNPRLYFKNKQRAREYAANIDACIKYDEKRKAIEILYHEYISEDDKLDQPYLREKKKKEEIKRLKNNLEILFKDTDEKSLDFPATHDTSKVESLQLANFEEKSRVIVTLDKCHICGSLIESRYRLLCKHGFCEICIKQTILESTTSQVNCPYPQCTKTIYLIDMMALLSQEELKLVFMKQKVPFLEQHSAKYTQCPTPDCENVLSAPDGTAEHSMLSKMTHGVVFCDSCGNDFCFRCKKNHYDTDCKSIPLKNEADVGNVKKEANNNSKQLATTPVEPTIQKACPGCRNTSARAKGSNHISCGYCKTSFCFTCLHDFGKGAERDEINDHFLSKHNGIKVQEDDSKSETNVFMCD